MTIQATDPICLIPARGGSKRFPRKNIAQLRGKPLIAYPIEAALGAGIFRRVWVSTEDMEIGAIAERFGAAAHERCSELATDASTLVQVCLDFVESEERTGHRIDVLCVILPTAVLLLPEDLRGGYERLINGTGNGVMAVTSFIETPFQALHEVDRFLRPYFSEEYARKSQELPRVWVDSGYFYFIRTQTLRSERTLYTSRLIGYPIPRDRSIDIDEPVHFRIAEALLEYHERSREHHL